MDTTELKATFLACNEAARIERERCLEIVRHARIAMNWNTRDALAEMIESGDSVDVGIERDDA